MISKSLRLSGHSFETCLSNWKPVVLQLEFVGDKSIRLHDCVQKMTYMITHSNALRYNGLLQCDVL